MYEVSKHFYEEFLPAVVEAARTKGAAMGRKWEQRVEALLAQEEHQWVKGLSAEEAEELRQMYQQRYNE
jgi:hypothetical protein